MSTRAVRTWVRSLLTTTLLVLGLVAGPAAPAAAADPASDCAADGGIYVYVVDQGTDVLAGCTHAQTGMGRLLELATVQIAGDGFICRIADRPERCVAVPASGEPYWSYWWWRDGQWQYATIGGSYRGVPGSVEAWHYSPGEQPPLTPSIGGAGVSGTSGPGSGTSGSSSGAPGGQATASDPAGSSNGQPGEPASAASEASQTQPSQSPSGRTQSSSTTGWLPTAITVLVVAAAGLGYGLWRRRRDG